MFSFFSKNKKIVLQQEVNKLRDELSLKEGEISSLMEQLESLKNSLLTFNPKQIDVFEKNLKLSKDENRKLKTELESLKNNINTFSNNYKFGIEDFYSSSKFNDVKDNLSQMEIDYIQQLNLEVFETKLENIKNAPEAKRKFENYLAGRVEWDIKVGIEKGERITKIFNKNRKFLNILSEYYIEFMDDLKNFNWETLLDKGFGTDQIEELKNKVAEYYSNRRI